MPYKYKIEIVEVPDDKTPFEDGELVMKASLKKSPTKLSTLYSQLASIFSKLFYKQASAENHQLSKAMLDRTALYLKDGMKTNESPLKPRKHKILKHIGEP